MVRFTLKFLPIIFGVVGIVLLGVSAWLTVRSLDLTANGLRAEGSVIRLQREYSRNSDGQGRYLYYPIVRFGTDAGEDIEFRGSTGTSSPSYRRGERVTVLYLPQSPQDARIDSFGGLWAGPLITGAMGILFTMIGGGFWFVRARRAKLEEWMRMNGRPVEADYTGVYRDTSFKVNGRSPWRITAQWQDPAGRKLHVFESKHLWFDPEPFVEDDRITVLIDPRNPKRHVFDLSFLPETAE
jgi:hypothetical protein